MLADVNMFHKTSLYSAAYVMALTSLSYMDVLHVVVSQTHIKPFGVWYNVKRWSLHLHNTDVMDYALYRFSGFNERLITAYMLWYVVFVVNTIEPFTFIGRLVLR
jgi:hypothetical protein